ncbi:Sec-independent protein translocase subunit TatB [Lampropedia puyangensis]|uniref:Sec-independent protein translocase protein TatB n=1 Tax=Lampropedia puyangensis TaxID=1330072 RepID=A0A4V6T2R0_9BURK|nr:Sec-independent protein translocase protein TatB [Lampropedia puyangensis]THU01976.1 Sec-independent protein translocase subunit TatB [Lampropedia puyangensis]
MFDLGISKLVMIGLVALIVIGPERLPKVARTIGTLLGKAQRYVNDVKREVNQAMEMDELRKVKTSLEGAARDLEQTVRTHASDFKSGVNQVSDELNALDGGADSDSDGSSLDGLEDASKRDFVTAVTPVVYVAPRKDWRKRRSAVPGWYKARHQVRKNIQSDAARVARLRVHSSFDSH